jgi:hypothetical protein
MNFMNFTSFHLIPRSFVKNNFISFHFTSLVEERVTFHFISFHVNFVTMPFTSFQLTNFSDEMQSLGFYCDVEKKEIQREHFLDDPDDLSEPRSQDL